MPPGHMVCHLPSFASISAGVSSHPSAANGNYAASMKRALSGGDGGSAVQINTSVRSTKIMGPRGISNKGRGLGDDGISVVTSF